MVGHRSAKGRRQLEKALPAVEKFDMEFFYGDDRNSDLQTLKMPMEGQDSRLDRFLNNGRFQGLEGSANRRTIQNR